MLHQKPDIFCKIELGLPLSKVQDLLAEIDANYGEIVKYKIDSDGQRKSKCKCGTRVSKA